MNLDLNRLSCGYGSRMVVKDFQARLSSGEIFCLLGPNGIGKTTLFKTVLGVLPAKSGSVTIDDRDLKGLSCREHARLMGYVPQAHLPPFAFVVFDVVLMGRTAHLGLFGRPGPKDHEAAERALERLAIGFLRDRVYTRLSGGERQMVLIARALAQEPAFLMMDEPTSGLDFGNQVQVLQNIMRLAEEGLGIIMTTHFPDHVFQCGHKVALLRKDLTYRLGSVDEVITEENLKATYGIPVAIKEVFHEGARFRFCQPLYDQS